LEKSWFIRKTKVPKGSLALPEEPGLGSHTDLGSNAPPTSPHLLSQGKTRHIPLGGRESKPREGGVETLKNNKQMKGEDCEM
jgi:hypothetical protein